MMFLFASAISTEEKDILQNISIEGKWIGAYVPISNEHILDISKKGNEGIFL